MRALWIPLVFALGAAAGWICRDLADEPAPPRSDRTPAARVAEGIAPLPPAPTPPPAEDAAPAAEGEVPAEGTAAEAAPEDDAEAARINEWFRSQGKQWKGWAGMRARQTGESLLAALPFDAAREARIQELLEEEAGLQAERALEMMLGEAEFDPNAFAWFLGLPPELSPRLEGELGTFLNDGEIQVVRAEVKRAHEKQTRDMADMQIGMMGIADLSDDQRTRMREVFSGKDMMTEQMGRFAEITRDRERMRRLLRGEGLQEEMERGFSQTRQRVRDILNDEQYGRYEAYERQMAKQAEIGLKMMASLLGEQRTGTQTPAAR